MSTATAHLLAEFEKLPIDVQREFSDAILHRSAHFDYDAPSDEELTAAARKVFSLLDREEGRHSIASALGRGRICRPFQAKSQKPLLFG